MGNFRYEEILIQTTLETRTSFQKTDASFVRRRSPLRTRLLFIKSILTDHYLLSRLELVTVLVIKARLTRTNVLMN